MTKKQSMKERLATKHLIDLGRDHRDAVLLAGCARSGTTWISDLINYDNGYRYIFEPFRNDRAEICTVFEGRQYLRPGSEAPACFSAVDTILSGGLRQTWSDKHNRRILSFRRLVKGIRANLMLKWIQEGFAGLPIVLLIRHPLAVVSSKLQLDWPVDFDTLLAQPHLIEDHLEPFRALLNSSLTRFEMHLIFWCIEHYVPLRDLRPGDAVVVFYENFCTDPQRELSKAFDFIGRGSAADAMGVLEEPSSVTRRESAINTGKSLTHGWREHITDGQRSRAREILEMFGLHRLYGDDDLPDTRVEPFLDR